ncbi:MAG: TrkH family potassium uptake protein [Bacillota bacterium]
MNKKVANYLGKLIISVGLYLLLPLFSLLFYPTETNHLLHFIVPAVLGVIGGSIILKLSDGVTDLDIDFKEASLVVFIVWGVAVGLGSIPFISSGQLNLIDAIFESMSGWSTTGLSMMDVEQTPKIFLLWRSVMQYIGGLGFVVLVMSSLLKTHDFDLYQAEGRDDRFGSKLMDTAKIIVKIYVFYTIIGIVMYFLAGMNLFDAINHAMSALSTGGFSTKAASMGYWNSSIINLITMGLMLLGTVSFAIHYRLLIKRELQVINDAELKLGVVLIPSFAILIAGLALFGTQFSAGMEDIVFSVISALSSAGLGTVSFGAWPAASLLLLTILMIIGGGVGATAGGLKQERVIALWKSMVWGIKKELYDGDQEITSHFFLRGKRIELSPEYAQRILSYVALYIFTFLLGVFVFVASGYSVIDSMFEYASTLSTIGLSVGITSPEMPTFLKLVQIITMWFGRLEFIAIIIAILKLTTHFYELDVRADDSNYSV